MTKDLHKRHRRSYRPGYSADGCGSKGKRKNRRAVRHRIKSADRREQE